MHSTKLHRYKLTTSRIIAAAVPAVSYTHLDVYKRQPLDNTGIAIGKVTDSNGDPVWNLLVCGIHKDTAGYVSSRTYSFNWANQDDILHENFGTTDVDVQPGLYYIYAID